MTAPTNARGDRRYGLEHAGWAFPSATGARKEHWWPVGSDRSGCGRYGRALTGVRPNPPESSRFVCAGCARKAEAAR